MTSFEVRDVFTLSLACFQSHGLIVDIKNIYLHPIVEDEPRAVLIQSENLSVSLKALNCH